MKVSLTLPDDAMPRTVFYERFLAALRRNARFTEDESAADVLFPAEDTAMETNWPRYGRMASAFTRGAFDQNRLQTYLQALAARAARLCIVNLNPFLRMPQLFKSMENVIIADGSLADWERSLNPRTIAMPALPLVTPVAAVTEKSVVASFRGVMSHQVRAELAKLHNGQQFICQIVDANNHVGKIDATSADRDLEYADLLAKSIFALAPRGDALFSYRLLEALSFNCIPVVLSDSWVLPFDRTINWTNVAVVLQESGVAATPAVLQQFELPRIRQMLAAGAAVYQERFADLDRIVESLLVEVERMG